MDVTSKQIIEKALKDLRDRADRYARYEKYYKGFHPLNFASEKFRNAFGAMFQAFADNLCPTVVDPLCDKLIVSNFAVESGDESIAAEAWAIWKANRMDKRAGEVHLEAVKKGDAYAIVWHNQAGEPVIYPQKAHLCSVGYDEENPGKIVWGVKVWFGVDKKYYLTLYLPERIEKYVTARAKPNGLPEKAADFVERSVDGETFPLENPHGVVPLFHFANNAGIGEFGTSEQANVIPLQNALNKSICDMLVGAEYVALPQRWIAGIELEYDPITGIEKVPFTPGVERIWTTDSGETKFGQFTQADLTQLLNIQNDFRVEMARVSGTPLHYFLLNTGNVPSGEALRNLEVRFTAKAVDRQMSFGNVWEDAMNLCLRIANKPDARLSTVWQDAAQKSEKETLENLILKQSLGVPDEQLMLEAGYGEKDVQKFLQILADKRAVAADQFNAA